MCTKIKEGMTWQKDELDELVVIQTYLPKQLSEEEVEDWFKGNNSGNWCSIHERYG